MKQLFNLTRAATLVVVAFISFSTGCKKVEVVNGDDVADANLVKQHKAVCVRQTVTGCDALVTEMTADGKNLMCGLPLSLAFPSSCISSPTYTATICVDRIAGGGPDCPSTVYTVADQNAYFNTAATAIENYLDAICGPSHSYVFQSFSYASGSNGCATAQPWLKVTFKYKCCS